MLTWKTPKPSRCFQLFWLLFTSYLKWTLYCSLVVSDAQSKDRGFAASWRAARNNFAQFFGKRYTCTCVTKQYDLVSTKGQCGWKDNYIGRGIILEVSIRFMDNLAEKARLLKPLEYAVCIVTLLLFLPVYWLLADADEVSVTASTTGWQLCTDRRMFVCLFVSNRITRKVVGEFSWYLGNSYIWTCWLRGTVVERQSLTGKLSLFHARTVADGWPCVAWWLSGRALDLRFTGRLFNSRPVAFT